MLLCQHERTQSRSTLSNSAKPSYSYCPAHLEQREQEQEQKIHNSSDHFETESEPESESNPNSDFDFDLDLDLDDSESNHNLNKSLQNNQNQDQHHVPQKLMLPPILVNIDLSSLHQRGYSTLQEWWRYPRHIYIGHETQINLKGGQVYHLDRSKWSIPIGSSFSCCCRHQWIECLQEYEKMIRESSLYHQLEELNGKILGCWCQTSSSELCHGELLIQLFKEKFWEKKNQEFRAKIERSVIS